jgi:hypothetical protein
MLPMPVKPTSYAVGVHTGRLIEINGPIRLRQHGALFLFF